MKRQQQRSGKAHNQSLISSSTKPIEKLRENLFCLDLKQNKTYSFLVMLQGQLMLRIIRLSSIVW